MKVLVTGAGGFVGRHLCAWLGREHEVIALTRRPATPIVGASATVSADLADYAALEQVVPPDIEAICHVAAAISHGHTPHAVEQAVQGNLLATQHIARLCHNRPVEVLVYSSSISVYRLPPERLPVAEDAPLGPATPYAVSKLMGEYVVSSSLVPAGVRRVILRYSSIYGPGQRPDSVLPIFVNRVRAGLPPVIFGSGGRSQDFVHLDDVCAANALALAYNGPTDPLVCNIGSGQETTMHELATVILAAFDPSGTLPIGFESADSPTPDPRFQLDISRAITTLGYAPGKLGNGEW